MFFGFTFAKIRVRLCSGIMENFPDFLVNSSCASIRMLPLQTGSLSHLFRTDERFMNDEFRLQPLNRSADMTSTGSGSRHNCSCERVADFGARFPAGITIGHQIIAEADSARLEYKNDG